jgi:sugar lactone lactonase YvrE
MRLANNAMVLFLFSFMLGSICGADAASISNPSTAIFVTNVAGNYVTLFSLGSNGDVPPIATIEGAATRLSEPEGIALDSKGNIYVTCNNWTSTGAYGGSSVIIFSAGSKGNATPIATIVGPHTSLRSVHSITVDSRGKIYVGTFIGSDELSGVAVFSPGSNGDVKPEAIIVGSSTQLQNLRGIAVAQNGTLLVANASALSIGNGVLAFPTTSDGDLKPSASISGAKTGSNWPVGIALDSRGSIYVANAHRQGILARISVYPAGSKGDVSPVAVISGANTGLDNRNLRGIAVDSEGNLYVTSDGRDGQNSSITVFAAGSTGNVKPMALINGDNTGLSAAVGIAIGPYPNAP